MPIRINRLDDNGRLYIGLEQSIKGLVISQCVSRPSHADVNVGDIVEQAGAAIYRAIAQSPDSEPWLYFRISVDARTRDSIVAQEIAPMLEKLRGTCPIKGWWWLYKSDPLGAAVRLRVVVPSRASREAEMEIETRLGELGLDFRRLCYEPELRLFGGPEGLGAAHEFFCRDSEFLARWAQQNDPPRHPIIPEGLSLALIIRALTASGLDLFECWDVFDRVCDKRKFANPTDGRFAKYRELATKVIRVTPDQIFQLYCGERAGLISEYRAFVDGFGQKISRIYFDGALECGLREFFVPIILFHWNRVGLAPFGHFGLSHSVAQELARLARKGTTQT